MLSEAFIDLGADSSPDCDVDSDSDREEADISPAQMISSNASESGDGPGIFKMLIEEARNTSRPNSLITTAQNIEVIMRSALAYNVELRVLVDLRKVLVEPYHSHEHILRDIILHGRLDYLEHSEHVLAAYFGSVAETVPELFVAAISVDRWDIVEWLHKHCLYITRDVFLKVYQAADSVRRVPRVSKLYKIAGHFDHITWLADSHREDTPLQDYVKYIREDKTSKNLSKYDVA